MGTVQLENGQITDLEYQLNMVGTAWVCQVCRAIFTTPAAIKQHNRTKHDGLGDHTGADVVI